MLAKIKTSILQRATKIAFYLKNEAYTYASLGEEVSKVRVLLQKERPDTQFIGILAQDDLQTYASIIAVWMEGYAFVPLSTKSPLDRNITVMQQVDSVFVLASEIKPRECAAAWKILDSSNLPATALSLDFESPTPEQIICMLFTSGSTGTPKGVPYTLRNLNCSLDAFFALGYEITEEDRFLQMFDLTFDMSLLSYLPAWCIGAAVCTVPETKIKYLSAVKVMQEHKVSFAAMVPSTLNLLKPYFSQINLPKLRYSILGGEAFYVTLATAWAACIPNARIVNISGPCETTMACVSYELEKNAGQYKSYQGILAFGRPWKNTQTILVDENRQVVEQGGIGELCFSGDHVMNGYWKLPEKNASVFFEREIQGTIKRFYRSGDLAFQDEHGIYYSCGRKDYQYKIQGYKVELGELETLTRKFTNTDQVVAIVLKNENDIFEIHLVSAQTSYTSEVILAYLKEKLPPYLLPTSITKLATLPQNISGKVDRQALRKIVLRETTRKKGID
ncbi:MAG: AMP-binding protein [Saprospiraceae bacterium]